MLAENGVQMKDLMKSILGAAGYRIVKLPSRRGTLPKCWQSLGINAVLDIGANIGQYAMDLRAQGYRGLIISVEANPDAHGALLKNSSTDKDWTITEPKIVSDEDGLKKFFVSENSVSSSCLEVTGLHTESEPLTRCINTIEQRSTSLDSIFKDFELGSHKSMIKLDIQGGEMKALSGGKDAIESAVLISLEMSCQELYSHQSLYYEVDAFLRSRNYELIDIEPGHRDPNSGRLLQFDATYLNTTNRTGSRVNVSNSK